ncbi:MAG: enoyl-CoA hydratase/isomerase family protein [Paracoccaceae bacterium]
MPDKIDTAEIAITRSGRAGLIHLNRPKALNALTHHMCMEICETLTNWADDPGVEIVMIDAEGDRAFCAGGDIVELYEHGQNGNHDFGRNFWRDEYRMNEQLATYAKPIVSFMQGVTMGGGVGLGCHVSHRIVGETLKLAMPECGIGLIPDVGGSSLLARARSGIGLFIGSTGYRMDPDDAIFAGFADYVVNEADWPALKSALITLGDTSIIAQAAKTPAPGVLRENQDEIAAVFADRSVTLALETLDLTQDWALKAESGLRSGSPLAILCAERVLEMLGPAPDIAEALELEFRFTYRASEESDLLEGIRAKVIERDQNPQWKYPDLAKVPPDVIEKLLSPLGAAGLDLKGRRE